MRRLTLYIVLALNAASVVWGQESVPVEIVKTFTGSTWRVIERVDGIPTSLLKLLPPLNGNVDYRMADDHEDIQNSDVVSKRGLPVKRLIWAVRVGDNLLVHYEWAAVATFNFLVVARCDEGAPNCEVVWTGESIRFSTFSDFRRYMAGRAIEIVR